MSAPGTLDREKTLNALWVAIDGQERKAQEENDMARVAMQAGNKLASDTHAANAARHWHFKAGIVQAAEAIGYTYLELFDEH